MAPPAVMAGGEPEPAPLVGDKRNRAVSPDAADTPQGGAVSTEHLGPGAAQGGDIGGTQRPSGLPGPGGDGGDAPLGSMGAMGGTVGSSATEERRSTTEQQRQHGPTADGVRAPTEQELLQPAYDSGELVLFYSRGSEADDLSSMCLDYPFRGSAEIAVPGARPLGDWLGGRQIDKWFKSREHFFHFVKCGYAARGPGGRLASELAQRVLGMSAYEAKTSTGPPRRYGGRGGRGGGTRHGGLTGLDMLAWNRDKLSVMAQAARQQAAGNPDFARRLQDTGRAWLAEASTNDSEWGIGLDAAGARRVPVESRHEAFGQNLHGRAVMLARADIQERLWLNIRGAGGLSEPSCTNQGR